MRGIRAPDNSELDLGIATPTQKEGRIESPARAHAARYSTATMATTYFAASRTVTFKLVGWGSDSAVIVTTVATATNFKGFGFPDFVVPVRMSHESMGYLVENCVSHF